MRKLRVTGDPHSHTNFGVLGFLLAGLPIFTGLVFSASSVSAADPTTAKNILTLYSYSDGASFGSGSLALMWQRARKRKVVESMTGVSTAARYSPARNNRVPRLDRTQLLAVFTLASLIFSCMPLVAQPPTEKNVLVLFSFSGDNSETLTPLKAELRAQVPSTINFYVENMENQRFVEQGYLESLAGTLHSTYRKLKLDLVIAESYPALRFAEQYRDSIFPGVPIVFLGVATDRLREHQLWANTTGVAGTVDIRGTIDLALRLKPDTTGVAVVTNESEFERYWLERVNDVLLGYRDRLREVDLVGLPAPQLLQAVATLPPHTMVLAQLMPQDSVQPSISNDEIVERIARQLPTYCLIASFCLNHGGIGAVIHDQREQVSLAANIATRVLSGERPENIPIAEGTRHSILIDWRQLRHWNISESALPPASVILYRPPSFWELYRKYIVAAVVVILAQCLLIAGLMWQRARKRKAEAVLRESEKRFRVMADTTPSLVWMCDQDGKLTYLNRRKVEFTGPDPNAGYGDTWRDYVHPDDLKDVLALLAQALKTPASFSNQYRLRRRDGEYRWIFDVVSPRVNGDGSFAGLIGSAIDITDQKVAQEALEKVSGRLIEAQEKERSRIAKELHDDIVQRLTLLSMEIESANGGSNGSAVDHAERSITIRQHCTEIAHDVQALSHQLHSSKLHYLGLVAGARAFCDEFSNQCEVSVYFTNANVPSSLPKEVSLCLFRIMQEALQNALKYSGVREFDVSLQGTAEALRLEVRDAGAGFDLEQATQSTGLGLVSMQERIHALHGQLRIESKPGAGTTVLASVPLTATNVSDPGHVKNWRLAG